MINRREFLRYTAGLAVASAAVSTGHTRTRAAVTGKRIPELELLAPDWPAAREALSGILPHWESLGLKIKVSFEPFEEAYPRILAHRFGHGACMIWGPGEERLDPGFFLREFYHSSRAQKGFWNYGRFQDTTVDDKLAAQDEEMDARRRAEKIVALQGRLAGEHAVFTLMHPPVWQAFNVKDWEGHIAQIGAGYVTLWTYLRIRSRTGRKIFRVGTEETVESFNPVVARNNVHRLVYDTFARWGPDGGVVPWAASAWKVIGDDEVEFTIRPGMRFHDGKAVTAEDARFSLETVYSTGAAAFPAAVREIERAETRGEDTVRIRLKRPHAPFLTAGICSIPVLPRHIWQEVDDPLKWNNTSMIGSGPFRLKSGSPGGEIILEANPEHRAVSEAVILRLSLPGDMEEAVEMLRRDELDALEAHLSLDAVDALASAHHLAVREAAGNGLLEVRGDLSRPPFNDKAFRRALDHAIPREEINRVSFRGRATLARNSVISPRLEQWGSARIPTVPFNLEKARNILKEAGYGWEMGKHLCCPPMGWEDKEGGREKD